MTAGLCLCFTEQPVARKGNKAAISKAGAKALGISLVRVMATLPIVLR